MAECLRVASLSPGDITSAEELKSVNNYRILDNHSPQPMTEANYDMVGVPLFGARAPVQWVRGLRGDESRSFLLEKFGKL